MSRIDELLQALIDESSMDDFTPKSRAEQILLCCINKHGIEHCEPPYSRIELLLQELALKIKEGANVPVDVETASEMTALLVEDNIGKVYRYTGETDETYNQGDIYIVEEGA